MSSAILAILLLGQFDGPIVYQYQFCGPFVSKIYVYGRTNNGIIEVPIVNGIIPRILTSWNCNQEIRTFIYDTGRPYLGGVIEYNKDYNPQPFVCRQPLGESKPKTIESPIRKLVPIEKTLPKQKNADIPAMPSPTMGKTPFSIFGEESDSTRSFPRY